ncbi:MAG: LytTR family DNA-binding domain-containing protein, partial [Mucinivorans sp.]
SAFEIFDHVQITAPVIFTTAYDEHALRAFKVNSIDYLLKPIAEQDVRQALAKLQRLTTDHTTTTDGDQLRHLVELLSPKRYTTHFLVPQHNDKFFPLTVGSISYFYINEGTVRAVTINSQTYILPQTLDEIADMVDPANFFRINRQYLISRDSVLDIGLWFNNRLSINLKIPTSDKILVSKVRVSDFKAWFAGQAH